MSIGTILGIALAVAAAFFIGFDLGRQYEDREWRLRTYLKKGDGK